MKTNDNFTDITVSLKWKTNRSSHEDITCLQRVNTARDFLYEYEPDILHRLEKDQTIKADKNCLSRYFSHEPSGIINISSNELKPIGQKQIKIRCKKGRFYPKGILKGVQNIFEVNMNPFRCIDVDKDKNTVLCDLNHPMAGKNPDLEIKIQNIYKKERDSGAGCRHLLEETGFGQGMQARNQDFPTDFFSGSPFEKNGAPSDEIFYKKARITAHTDSLCRKNLKNIHKQILKPGSKVLDLMTSVYSHYPEEIELDAAGIGMNMEEMNNNSRLNKKIVKDINKEPEIPFEDEKFDVVTCSMSVEYMTRPIEIFQEVKRVLKKGGTFAVSFSNRWFPGKEIKIWGSLHEYERMGLVCEYFHSVKGFTNLKTISMKGFPRPYEDRDRYKDTLWYSDPLFAVYAEKQ